MAQVKVLYFASLRERRGTDEELVETKPEETLEQLYVRLFPPTAEGSMPVAFALNQVYALGHQIPAAGDEVSFLPPLGGG